MEMEKKQAAFQVDKTSLSSAKYSLIMTRDNHLETFAFNVNANLKSNINSVLHELIFNRKNYSTKSLSLILPLFSLMHEKT